MKGAAKKNMPLFMEKGICVMKYARIWEHYNQEV